MSSEITKSAVSAAKEFQRVAVKIVQPPSETTRPANEPVLPHSLFSNTRGYIEKIVYQINRTYEHTCYDACAVMIRRLVEILIIEAFEHNSISSKIKNPSGDFLYLQDLINAALSESWSLGRNTKSGLSKLKIIGDQSAHSRRYNAKRKYIDDIIIDLRTVAEEFLYLSGMKN